MDNLLKSTSTPVVGSSTQKSHLVVESDTKPPQSPPVRYSSRTCRICLEEVQPTSEICGESFPSILHPAPKVRWISENPASGRLIRPCRCKGSQKYVHEGCLQLWRHVEPAQQQRKNFWECPTCKFQYRLERMAWSRLITSTFARVSITLVFMLIAIFTFGFVADPIINMYINPINTIVSMSTEGRVSLKLEEQNSSWTIHFLKGLASVGVFGVAKTMLAMSSWQWFLRGFSVRTVRRRDQSSQDIFGGIPWTVIFVGAITVMIAVWKFVERWTDSLLDKAGESVAGVQDSDDDEEIEQSNYSEN